MLSSMLQFNQHFSGTRHLHFQGPNTELLLLTKNNMFEAAVHESLYLMLASLLWCHNPYILHQLSLFTNFQIQTVYRAIKSNIFL
jgi:hypothetical protein